MKTLVVISLLAAASTFGPFAGLARAQSGMPSCRFETEAAGWDIETRLRGRMNLPRLDATMQGETISVSLESDPPEWVVRTVELTMPVSGEGERPETASLLLEVSETVGMLLPVSDGDLRRSWRNARRPLEARLRVSDEDYQHIIRAVDGPARLTLVEGPDADGEITRTEESMTVDLTGFREASNILHQETNQLINRYSRGVCWTDD